MSTWMTVPAPTLPLVSGFSLSQSQLSNHTWMYPFKQPIPTGVYEVRNAIIDKSQKRGVWSEPRTLTLQSGWFLYAHCWNQPVTGDEAGVVWKLTVISATDFEYNPYVPGSEHYYYTGWSGQYQPNAIAPYSSTTPHLSLLGQDAYRLYHTGLFATGGRHTTVAPAPVCYGSSLPLVPMEVAYCRVTETGETALSPSYYFTPPPINDGWTLAETCRLGFGIQEQQPQGVLGYHVYVQLEGEFAWRRIPAPHCHSEPATVDDWLWQWHDRQPTIVRLASANVGHAAVATPQSRVSSLHLALHNTTGNVVVDDVPLPAVPPALPLTPKPTVMAFIATLNTLIAWLASLVTWLFRGNSQFIIDTYCPVIDEWRNTVPDTFGRRISARDGGKWILRQQQSMSGHKYWPVLAIENSYSQWIGVEVQANGGSAALSFADFSGGQAFGNRFIDCNFYTQPSPTGLVCGILIDSKSTGQYGSHVASETKFFNTKANGDIPIWIGGQQCANVRFNETNITSTGSGRQCCGVYLECPNQVVFANGLNIDAQNGGAVFRAAVFPAKLLVDGIWLDQGSPCLIEACCVTVEARFNAGKLNIRGASPSLSRIVCCSSLSRLVFNDIDVQPDPGIASIDVVNGSYNRVDLRFTDTLLSEMTILREPTRAQTDVALAAIAGWMVSTDVPEPGMRLTLPAPPIVLEGQPTPEEQTVVFNSMTGRQNVLRSNWSS